MTTSPLTLLLPLLLACGSDPDAGRSDVTDGGTSDDGATDSGSTAGDDGTGGDDGTDEELTDVLDVTAEITDVHTVVRVSWTTSEPVRGAVEFGPDDTYGMETAWTEEGTEHEVLLLGNHADTDVHFRVVLDDGAVSDDQVITTESLPSGLPSLTATGTATDWNWQVVPLQGTSFAVAIIDDAGEYVWYDSLDPGGNLMRAVISHDRQWIIYCLAGSQTELEQGKIVWVSLDGSERREVAFPYVDHDMVELPDGTIGGIVVTTGPSGWEHKTADRIVEMDADGNQTEIWSAWDAFDFDALGMRESPEPNITHGNGLDYVPEEDAYYVSLKALGSIARIDRATGDTDWVIHGIANEFSFPPEDEMVMLQHQFHVLDDTLLVFDNGDPSRGYSRAVEVAIDPGTLEAENVWEYIRDPSVFVFAKGDVERFESGNTQVVWSASGEIQNVTPDGDVLWQLNTDLGQAITFVQVVDDLYLRD